MVREDEVGAREAQAGEDLREAGEVGATDDENVLAVAESAKAPLGLRQLDRIDVEADEAASRKKPRQKRFGVASPSERRVDGDEAQRRGEGRKDLVEEDGDVASRGRLPRGEDLRALLGITRRVKLLVLLRERPWVRSAVARTSARLLSAGIVRLAGRHSIGIACPVASGTVTPSHAPTVGARS